MKREFIQIGLSQFRIPFDELFSSDWLCRARRVVEKPVTGDKTTVTLIFHVNVSPAFLSVTFSVEFVQSEVSSWSKYSKKSIFSFKKDSFKYLRSVYHLRWFFCKIFYNSNPDSDRAIVNLFYSKSLNTRRLKFHWDWYFFSVEVNTRWEAYCHVIWRPTALLGESSPMWRQMSIMRKMKLNDFNAIKY